MIFHDVPLGNLTKTFKGWNNDIFEGKILFLKEITVVKLTLFWDFKKLLHSDLSLKEHFFIFQVNIIHGIKLTKTTSQLFPFQAV